MNGSVEVVRPIRGEDHHKLRRWRSCVVKHRCQSITQGLAHCFSVASRSQEGISLINKKKHTPATAVHPLEELVQLSHSLLFQWRHITTRHDGILQARVLSKALRHHGLASSRRAIEHNVHEWHASFF